MKKPGRTASRNYSLIVLALLTTLSPSEVMGADLKATSCENLLRAKEMIGVDTEESAVHFQRWSFGPVERNWATQVLDEPIAAAADITRARFIMGYVSDLEILDVLKRLPTLEMVPALNTLTDPHIDGHVKLAMLDHLGLYSDSSLQSMARSQTKPVQPSLNDVFNDGAARLGLPLSEIKFNDRKATNDRDRVTQPAEAVIALDVPLAPLALIYANLASQVAASPSSTEFSKPDFSQGVHQLKLKPIDQWSATAQRALVNRPWLSNIWISASLVDGETKIQSALPALSFYLKDPSIYYSRRARQRPPSSTWLNEIASQLGPDGLRQTLFQGGYERMNVNTLSVRPDSMLTIPIEVVDWELSVFSANFAKRQVPVSLPAFESSGFKALVTNFGQEVVLIDSESGPLRAAAQRSKIASVLPQDWQEVPYQFRTLPRSQADLNAYVAWLSTRPLLQDGPKPKMKPFGVDPSIIKLSKAL